MQVNLRSPGEAAGLQAGDVILTVNGQDISLLRHKEAQEAIKRAGNNFVLAVKRYENLRLLFWPKMKKKQTWREFGKSLITQESRRFYLGRFRVHTAPKQLYLSKNSENIFKYLFEYCYLPNRSILSNFSILSNSQFCPIFQFCPTFNFVQFSILFNFQLCPNFQFVQFWPILLCFIQFSFIIYWPICFLDNLKSYWMKNAYL